MSFKQNDFFTEENVDHLFEIDYSGKDPKLTAYDLVEIYELSML